jgi:hypothetical protein
MTEKLLTAPSYVEAVWVDGELVTPDDVIKWGGKEPPPPIGTEVIALINGCGPAVVTGYYVEHNWLGLMVKLHEPPAWFLKQNGGNVECVVFGPEFKRVEA